MKWGVVRIAVIDFSAHHGHDTQYLFEHDPSILFASSHDEDYISYSYPGNNGGHVILENINLTMIH